MHSIIAYDTKIWAANTFLLCLQAQVLLLGEEMHLHKAIKIQTDRQDYRRGAESHHHRQGDGEGRRPRRGKVQRDECCKISQRHQHDL